MYNEAIEKIAITARKKVDYLDYSLAKYFISSAYAGVFIGIGLLISVAVGNLLSPSPVFRIGMGLSFVIALNLVAFTGTELFTGNNFVMTVGLLQKTVSFWETLRLWLVSYVGNFIGALILSYIFVSGSFVQAGDFQLFFEKVALTKASLPFSVLLFRGILCNFIVCLAVYLTFRLENEVAKLLMICLCLFTFVTSGFEHSIANMTVYGVALFESSMHISISQMFANLIPVTLGNMLGGVFFMGVGVSFLKTK